MNFNMLWISLFNTTELLGVNLGFWAAMLVCLLVSAGIWILIFLWFGLYEGRQCND